jgi:site-specific recombinase XerC
MSVDGFSTDTGRVGEECGLPLVHPHMLRHSTGFALADKGRDLREIQDYLGHRSINNTVIDTKLRPGRFDRIWDRARQPRSLAFLRDQRGRTRVPSPVSY